MANIISNTDNIRLNQIIDSGVNIYGSREKIRSNLVKYAKKYLNISDDSDISKANYLAYLIDMLSILTSNQIYYQSKLYNEFFLVSAEMNESVQNLAKWIGYTIPKAECAIVDVMFTMPLTFSANYVNFNFDKYFQVRSNGIPFTIKSNDNDEGDVGIVNINKNLINNTLQGKIVNNSAVTVRDYNGYHRPVYISNDGKSFSFTLQFEQCKYEIQTFNIPTNLGQNQFYQKNLEFDGQVAAMDVYVCSPTVGQSLAISSEQAHLFESVKNFDPTETIIDTSGQICKFVKWTQCINGIYTISSTSTEYDWIGYYNQGIISFGNDVLGKQPTAGSMIVCILKLTKGADGNVINNTISEGDELTIDNNLTVSYSVTNFNAAYGGKDILSTSELKNNAIVNLKTRKRLVTDDDYNNITDVVTNTTLTDCIPILKRSDIKVNDISLYFILNHYSDGVNNIVPTRNVTIDLVDPVWNSDGSLVLPKNTIVPVQFGDQVVNFTTIFNAKLNKNTRTATYYYTATNIDGVAVELDTDNKSSTLSQNAYITSKQTNFYIDSDISATIDINYPINIKLSVNNIANRILKEKMDIDYNWIVDDFLEHEDGDTVKPADFEIVHFKSMMITKWGENDTYDNKSHGYSETVTIKDDSENPGYSYKEYKDFNFVIENYSNIPNGKQRYEFYVMCLAPKRDKQGNIIACHDGVEVIGVDYTKSKKGKRGDLADGTDSVVMEWQIIKKFYSDVIVNQDLSGCMQSSITVDNYLKGKKQKDGINVYHIHECPTILQSYYRDVMYPKNGKSNFEINVLQKLMENVNFSSKRMMTDFTNIKFADTYGSLTNLRYNKCEYVVESRYIHTPWWDTQEGTTSIPEGVILNDEYIPPFEGEPIVYYVINGKVDDIGDIPTTEYIGYIAIRIPTRTAGGITYSYTKIQPQIGTIIKVKDELDSEGFMQTCIWNGRQWISVEKYTIPLNIKIRVHVDEDKVTKSDDTIIEEVITVLSEYYNDTSKMGLQRMLDRSEIIKVCRSLDGIEYVEVVSPEFDIKFDYEINDLSQKELLDFTPQYIGFRTITDTNKKFSDTTINVEVVRK